MTHIVCPSWRPCISVNYAHQLTNKYHQRIAPSNFLVVRYLYNIVPLLFTSDNNYPTTFSCDSVSIPLLFTINARTCAFTTGYQTFLCRTSPCAHCPCPEDDPCWSRNVGLILTLNFTHHHFIF